MAKVTVGVVSHNSRLHLPACLSSVARQEEVDTEVIVVDNASADGSAAWVSGRSPTARLAANQDNRGFATAVNQGLGMASGEFVLPLNPDAVLLPGSLARWVELLEMHPRAAAARPRQGADALRLGLPLNAGGQWSWIRKVGADPASDAALGLADTCLTL
jgi:GT2 family glycosyltransferase